MEKEYKSFEIKKVKCKSKGCKNLIEPIQVKIFFEMFYSNPPKLAITYKVIENKKYDERTGICLIWWDTDILMKGRKLPIYLETLKRLIAMISVKKKNLLLCTGHKNLEKIKD